MDALTIVFGAVDLPLIVGMVVLIEVAKKFIKIPAKGWLLVLVVLGFGMAFLKVSVTQDGWKNLILQGVVYAAAAELAYQVFKGALALAKKARK